MSTPYFSSVDADASVAWYAEALATVLHFRLQDAPDIVARLRVTPAEWATIDSAWTAALSATGALLDPALALSFATCFARARTRIIQSTEEPSPLREMPSYLRRPPVRRGERSPGPVVKAPGTTEGVAATNVDQREKRPSEAASAEPPRSTAHGSDAPPRPSPAAPAQSSAVAAPPTMTARRSALAGTALGSTPPPGPALPFGPAPPCAPAPPGKRARPPAQFTGTTDGVDVPQSAVLPFVPSEVVAALPELTLEEYAELRAQLTVRGEDDAETWRHFGVASHTVKEAIRVRFATRFRQDPAMQARFVELIQKRSAQLRAR